MNKFIGILLLIIGLIASVIEIYSFVKEEYPWFLQQFYHWLPTGTVSQNHVDHQIDKEEHSATTQPLLEPNNPIDLEGWKRQIQAVEKKPTDLNEPVCQHDEDCQSVSRQYQKLPQFEQNHIDLEGWKRHIQPIEEHKDY